MIGFGTESQYDEEELKLLAWENFNFILNLKKKKQND